MMPPLLVRWKRAATGSGGHPWLPVTAASSRVIQATANKLPVNAGVVDPKKVTRTALQSVQAQSLRNWRHDAAVTGTLEARRYG